MVYERGPKLFGINELEYGRKKHHKRHNQRKSRNHQKEPFTILLD